MASIEKRVGPPRRDGTTTTRWTVRYRDPNGQQHKETWASERDAKRRARELDALILTATYTDPRAGAETFRSWATRWSARQHHISPITAAKQNSHITQQLTPHFGSTAIGDITTSQIHEWIDTAKTAGQAPASIASYLELLTRCLEAAVAERLIPANPARGVRPPHKPAPEPTFLTIPQIMVLAGQIRPRWRALILVAAFCGPRWGELVGLRRSDRSGPHLRISTQLGRTTNGGLERRAPKTKASIRTITLPQFICTELDLHTARYVQEGPDALLFTSEEQTPLRTHWRAREFKPALTTKKSVEAGIPAALTPHDLRHTAASLAIAAGADIKTVQAMLGHATSRMTLDRYGHLFPGQTDAVATRLDALFTKQTHNSQC